MARKTSPWKLGGLTPLVLAKRVGNNVSEDDIFGRSAELSYYFLLALFPLLLFLTSVLGLFAAAGAELRANLFTNLERLMPVSAGGLVQQTVNEVANSAGRGKAIFGILGALWAASAGMAALTNTLNIAYKVKESRPWWRRRLIALALTLEVSLLVVSALVLVLYGGSLAELLSRRFGMADVLVVVWKIAQWPVVLAFMFVSFSLIYYLAPDLKNPQWHWITPGAAIGLVLWLIASFAFKFYLSFFNTYSKTYGSLGAVIILMLWFYITGAAILVGGEFNSEIERAQTEANSKIAEREKSPHG